MIYLHVPFCKQACHYCDFYFSTNPRFMREVVEAMCQEIALSAGFFAEENYPLPSIYFGGGTPSLLPERELSLLFEYLHRHHCFADDAEITLEANPDDLSPERLRVWKKLGINRLSLGIQSFHQPFLEFMNRAHNAREAERCVKMAQDAGFSNLTIDLIYSIPAPSHDFWRADLEKALRLGVPHLSCYNLTIEERTKFGQLARRGTLQEVPEDFAVKQFEMLMEETEKADYVHYEISNFAKPGFRARHNSAYWKKERYLGIGPSAHSYDGARRWVNVPNNLQYRKSLANNALPRSYELLSPKDHLNEYLLTMLRTSEGISLKKIQNTWPEFRWLALFDKELSSLEAEKLLVREKQHVRLTKKGKLLTDEIALKLFLA